MKISTKGRYGVKIMLFLALNYKNGKKPLNEIARSQDLSEKYLEQLMMPLLKAGLVCSQRGSQGGYSLTRPPADISTGDVLRALEGNLAPVVCVSDDEVNCDRLSSCASVVLWKRIKDAVDLVVDSTSLADLLDDYADKNGSCQL